MIVDRQAFQSVRTGLEIARRIRMLHPDDWKVSGYDRLLGNRQVLDAVTETRTVAEMEAIYGPDLEKFRQTRAKFLLYK